MSSRSRSSARVGFSPAGWNGARKIPKRSLPMPVSPRGRRLTIDGRRLLDQDLGTDGDPRVQVLDVGDVHPDAAVRRARADRPVLGGPVDADAVGDPEPARLERVVRRPARDDLALEAA